MVDDEQDDAPRRRWPWWHRQTTTTRRLIRTGLLLLVTLLVSGVVGVLTASTDSSLGPHVAHYEVTAQHEIVVDLGPLGTVLLDSPMPWPLGVEVVVQEIPAELTAVQASPVTGLAGDVAAYAQVVAHPDAVVADAVSALVRDALGRAAMVAGSVLLVVAGARLASRGLLRREVAHAARRPGVVPLAAVVVVTLVAVPTALTVRDRPAPGRTISALAGTPMEDLRMTGRMAQLIDTYGGYLVEAYEENEAFYASVNENLEAAYAQDRAPSRPPGIPVVSPAPTDTATDGVAPPADDATAPVDDATAPADDGAASPEATGSPDDGVAAASEAATEAPARVEPVTFLLVSDLHCNVGMASVIAGAARLSGASAVLDAGDTVMSGTAVESYCVNAFAGEIADDLPLIVSTGNHDSVTTAEQMRDAGYVVLGGSVVEVDGVRIIGDTDPTLTAVGEGTRPERDETVPEMGERLAEEACSTDRADVVLVHNPRAALPALEQGCVPLALSGHWHRREGPEVHGAGTRYVSSSTAGASGGATVGPLNGPAEMTVLRVDSASGRPLDYRVVTVGTDTTVQLGRWYRFPDPADSAPTSGDTESGGPSGDPTDAESSAGTERR
ncbi:metallophosphoesterase [Georgenia satyanarayanai]|uniref:metallophosphoesterase family protein n=1 Tax=Georgenia satyanarayanai TaxID=860221 RepID=UPI00203A5492|nr:metallophosphoesterase [Georgenia satyanarayanai]MCM3661548.1 metallophosphoesterase [Georgenia satyanarayanai]